ncbi:hypothetical protein DUNSADRAFT_93 [Dunaliella salina]|uniref:Encoded protein n=1 Tax=Dunaliella salina TaxID=3046 RepID=A0ABQ7H8W1_DUNSA|nr:hypothetical protein DUNSADRAFT_93 [Dunaliella salina]|eukprot:KAF5843291.1 hypothetical protein DUNSADRAFT_93 [Dunaliella salina]
MRHQTRSPARSTNTSRAASEAPSQANSQAPRAAPSRASSFTGRLSRFTSRTLSPGGSPETNDTDEDAKHQSPKSEPQPPKTSSSFLPPIFRSRTPQPQAESQATAEGCERQVVIPAASRLRPRSSAGALPTGIDVPGRSSDALSDVGGHQRSREWSLPGEATQDLPPPVSAVNRDNTQDAVQGPARSLADLPGDCDEHAPIQGPPRTQANLPDDCDEHTRSSMNEEQGQGQGQEVDIEDFVKRMLRRE